MICRVAIYYSFFWFVVICGTERDLSDFLSVKFFMIQIVVCEWLMELIYYQSDYWTGLWNRILESVRKYDLQPVKCEVNSASSSNFKKCGISN